MAAFSDLRLEKEPTFLDLPVFFLSPSEKKEGVMKSYPRKIRAIHPLTLLAALFFLLLTTSLSLAQSRRVFVNGIRMTDRQVAQLEYYACTPIPNGSYWMNTATGAWGYMGNPRVQGYYGDQCRRGSGSRHKSLSERGLLYSPGEILNSR